MILDNSPEKLGYEQEQTSRTGNVEGVLKQFKKWSRLLAYLLIYFRIVCEGIEKNCEVMLLRSHLCYLKIFCLEL